MSQGKVWERDIQGKGNSNAESSLNLGSNNGAHKKWSDMREILKVELAIIIAGLDVGGKRVKTDSVGWFENKVEEEDGI